MIKKYFLSVAHLLKRFFHRLFLWTKPAYLRHRTTFQKQFDLKLIYTFWGFLFGILVVIALFLIRHTSSTKTIPEEPVLSEETSLVQPQETVTTIVDENDALIIQETNSKISTTSLVLKKNETLSNLLKRGGLSLQEALNVSNALDIVFDVRKIRPGQTFDLFFIDKTDTFIGLKTETRNGDLVSVLKNKKGEYIPQSKEGVIENKLFALNGKIKTNFSMAAEEAHVPLNIANQVIRALDGQIDFNKNLKEGDTFKIVYEQKMTDTGKEVGKSQLLYVSLTTNKKTYQRYFFIDGAGTQGFYDENGSSMPQTLLQRPLGNAKISSKFGMRLHPILGYKIQHNGIDFAAKIGTPVPAGADGVVVKIGRNGGYGKYIKIKHNETYSTAYGHLDSFNSDLHTGSYVKKGEIIGYVGNTGRSTGPHLHYEVVKNGTPVTPLKTYTIPQRVLKNETLTQFKKKKSEIDAFINKH
ncbi:MAG: peptidoglycan DD-metalloendopeptidase family protein [Alphaproteobacteria bacterium]|nr:peptidoglycan DD-metalloendopeptidase family protein [Alphaproteobacteria bacterium]